MMQIDPAWLEWIAMTSRPLTLAGIWLTGFVLALRRRPAVGASLTAAGFAFLTLGQVLDFLFTAMVGREPDRFWSVYFEAGNSEVFLEPWMVFATADATTCLIEAVGAVCVIIGGLRAWRESATVTERLRAT